MSQHPAKPFYISIPSGDSFSDAADLGQTWQSVYLECSMTSASELNVYGSTDNSTFRPIYHPAINTSTAEINKFAIASGATTAYVPIPSGFQYIKVYQTAAATDGQSFTVLCSDIGN